MPKIIFSQVVRVQLLIILLSPVFSAMAMNQASAEATTVLIEPTNVTAAVNQTFSVDINVTDVADLFGYDFVLWFRNDALQCVNASRVAGNLLEPADPVNQFVAKWEIKNTYNVTHGRIWLSYTLLIPETGRTGNGILVRLNLKSVKGGLSPLVFGSVKLVDSGGDSIGCETVDGFVTVGRVVKVPDDFAGIQAAVNDANPGETVFVRAGVYHQSEVGASAAVVLNKSVSLIGENKETTIIDGDDVFPRIIHVTADGVSVREFTIQNGEHTVELDAGGIFMNNSNGHRIIDNVVKDVQCGINLWNSSDDLIIDNIVAVITSFSDSAGIRVFQGLNNSRVYHNFFISSPPAINGSGVQVWDDGYPSGGNYWDTNTGVDEFSGPYQNVSGADGLGDTPFVVSADNEDRYPLMKHDIRVVDIAPAKTVVGRGFAMRVNFTVENKGSYADVFEVVLFANSTRVASRMIGVLSKDSAVSSLIWNSSGFAFGYYSLSVQASPLAGEVYLPDNTLVQSWVFVGMPGDVASEYGVINILDLTTVAIAFGSHPNDPNWSAKADINNDNSISILDIVTVALHFGQSYLL